MEPMEAINSITLQTHSHRLENMIETLPITIMEEILSYLNGMDKYILITTLLQERSDLGTSVYSKLSLSMDYRLKSVTMRPLFNNVKQVIRELDLTGVYWIPAYVLKAEIKKCINLEHLRLFGTNVILDYRKNANNNDISNYFMKLKNLRFLAIAVVPAVPTELIAFYTSFYQYRHFHRSSKDEEFQEGMVFKVGRLEYHGKDPSINIQIHDNSWLKMMSKAEDFDSYHEIQSDVKKSIVVIPYTDLVDLDPSSVEAYFRNYIDHEAISLERPLIQWTRIERINLEPVKLLTNLTTLYIEVIPNIGNMFMKLIFQKCRFLKKLFLVSFNVQYHFSHITYAQHLEDLTVHVHYPDFNFNKFFDDVNQNKQMKLRRLCLHIGTCNRNNNNLLDAFLQNNPQLVFLFITCTMTAANRSLILDVMKNHKKKTHQVFHCMDSNYLIQQKVVCKYIPCAHWDMIDRHYWYYI